MTLDTLQAAMIASMRTGDKARKTAISNYIAAIKKVAIDKGCRDNIDEKFVNTELIKIQKSVKEQVDTCPETRPDLLEKYKAELEIINEFAPQLITDSTEIINIIKSASDTILTKKEYMKFFNMNYRGKVDMKVVNEVVDYYIDYNCNAKVVPQ